MLNRLLFCITVVVSAFIMNCGAHRHQVEDIRGSIRFKGDPKDALLIVNETYLGPIRMFETSGVLLRPGKHRVEVSKDGWFTEYILVDVEPDKVLEVEIKLREIP